MKYIIVSLIAVLAVTGCATKRPVKPVSQAPQVTVIASVLSTAAELERQFPAQIWRMADGEYVVMTQGMKDGEYYRTRDLKMARFAKTQYFVEWAEQITVTPTRGNILVE
jgi:hypothetical protein